MDFFGDFGLRHKSVSVTGWRNYRYAVHIENLILVY